jgi:hypothetical protein
LSRKPGWRRCRNSEIENPHRDFGSTSIPFAKSPEFGGRFERNPGVHQKSAIENRSGQIPLVLMNPVFRKMFALLAQLTEHDAMRAHERDLSVWSSPREAARHRANSGARGKTTGLSLDTFLGIGTKLVQKRHAVKPSLGFSYGPGTPNVQAQAH